MDKQYVIENLDNKGFFLIMNFMNGCVGFSSDLQIASKYSDVQVKKVFNNLRDNGFTFNLKPREIVITYQLVD